MKKTIRLTEYDLINIVKRIISEMEFKEAVMNVDPFILSATQNGNMKITNTKTGIGHVYSMEAWKGVGIAGNWFDCTIKDFPDGIRIKLTAMGKEYNIKVDKLQIKNLLQNGFGKQELEHTLVDDSNKQEVKFTKVV
jgi:hypothetical protein